MKSLFPQDDAWRTTVSPKQHPSREQRDWYPYYAGFTEKFVHNVLSANWHDFRNVLDPWSGSGTTCAVCTKTGIPSIGIDINPALTVIARGRLVPSSARDQLVDVAQTVVGAAHDIAPVLRSSDLLRLWFTDDAISHIRSLENAIRDVCGTKEEDNYLAEGCFVVDNFSVLVSFLYTALFATVRNVLGEFRSTNPTWIKTSRNSRQLANPSYHSLIEFFRRSVDKFSTLLSIPERAISNDAIPIITGDANRLPLPDHSFDSAITSPPYATRLDYVNGTLPELAIIGATDQSIALLRQQVTGSPVVQEAYTDCSGALRSAFANDLLQDVQSHPSKGSANYYYPWLRNYLWKLQSGLRELDRVVKVEGAICIVVQDSRYKELHIDLQRIVCELLAARGRHLKSRIDHPAKNLRFSQVQLINVRQHSKRNVETLLVFGPKKQ